MVSMIPLGTGLAATVVGVVVIATLLYFTLLSLRNDRHSPPTG